MTNTCGCTLNTIYCGCGRLVWAEVVEAALNARKGLVCGECGARMAARELGSRIFVLHIQRCERPVRHAVTVSIGGRRVR